MRVEQVFWVAALKSVVDPVDKVERSVLDLMEGKNLSQGTRKIYHDI